MGMADPEAVRHFILQFASDSFFVTC